MKNIRETVRRLAAWTCGAALAAALVPGNLTALAADCQHTRNPAWWTYESTQPTCTEQGRSYRICSRCGAEEVLSTTPATGHSWERKTEEADGSRDGRVYQVCRVCGKKETLSTISAKLHSGSGSTAMKKLSRQEIAQLLRSAPQLGIAVSEDNYDVLPSVQAPYRAGEVKDSVLQAALDRLNLCRRIAGVPAAALDEDLCGGAQWGAVVLAAGGRLSHSPGRPADMEEADYQKGASAAAGANLASGYSLTGAVDAWMADSDPANLSQTGHRRWQLNPTLGKVGFGVAGDVTLEAVLDRSGEGCPYDYLAWPASGNFPDELFEAATAWSVQLNPDTYQIPDVRDLTVTLTGGGRTWTFRGKDTYEPSSGGKFFACGGSGYGDGGPCLIFRPDGVKAYQGDYTVEIQGLRDKDGFSLPLTYRVTFFHAGNVILPSGQPAEDPFRDVAEDAYYREAVLWALEKGVTTGVTDTAFQPSAACTRGQVVTFLWRAKRSPEPEARENPFQDVSAASPFYQAILWAREKGVTAGARDGAFQPGTPCTNAQVVTFLWRAEGEPAARGESPLASRYPGQYFTEALAWADTAGVLEGTVEDGFQPHQRASRANIVTYLYRLNK